MQTPASITRIVKIFELTFPLKVMPLPSPMLRLVLRPTFTHTQRQASLRHALTQYVEHFHHERNHQGKGNVLLFPTVSQDRERAGPVQCRERLGGAPQILRTQSRMSFLTIGDLLCPA